MCTAVVKAQENIVSDSLQKILLHAPNDSTKCVMHIALCRQYTNFQINFTKAFYHANEGKKIAEKLKNEKLLGHVLNELGQVYDMMANPLKARESFCSALKIFTKYNDSSWIGSIEQNLGLSYYYKGKLDSALYWNFEALEIENKLHNRVSLARIYSNIGMCEVLKDEKRKGIKYFEKSYTIYSDSTVNNDAKFMYGNAANAMNNIGDTYKDLKEFDSAIFHINKAIKIAKKYHIKLQIRTGYIELGFCYNGLKNYNKALFYFNKAKADPETITDIYVYSNFLLGSSESYLGLQKYNKAIEVAKKGINLKSFADNNYYDMLSNFYQTLSKAFEGNKDFVNAYFYFKKFKTYSDSLLLSKSTDKLNELSSKFEFQQKQQEIDLLQKENLLKDVLLKENKKSIIIYWSCILLASIISIAMLFFYLNKQKINKKLEEKNRIISDSLKDRELLLKEIHHRVKNNLQVISSLLNLQAKSITNPEALLAIKEGRDRIKNMTYIHQNLYEEGDLMGVSMKEYIEKLVKNLFKSYNIKKEKIELKYNVDDLKLNIETVIPVGLILNELLSNALKYAFVGKENGMIKVVLQQNDESLFLEVSDNGIGMPANWNINKINTLGFQIVQSFVDKLKAKFLVTSKDGTCVGIIIKNKNLIA